MRAIDSVNNSTESNQRQTDFSPEPRSAVVLPFNACRSRALVWWRTRHPWTLSRAAKDSRQLRLVLKRRTLFDPDWPDAIGGDPSAAIAVRAMKHMGIDAPEIDTVLSAVLACAIDGDSTCPIELASK